MNQSLQRFNFEFLKELRNLYWQQWAALGVAANIEPEKDTIVDIESLIISTYVMYRLDLRLSEGMVEWVHLNKDLIIMSRLKRIVLEFFNSKFGDKIKLIDKDYNEIMKSLENKRFFFHHLRELVSDKGRDIIARPLFSHPSTLHLKLRSFTGTDTRADVLLYLLLSDEGNSYSIAKDIIHDQKNVYRILEQWSDVGMVTKIEEARKNRYILNNKKEWLKLFGYTNFPNYVNWTRVFLLYNTIAKALVTEPWHSDEYLMSSLLNDLENEIKEVEVMGGEVDQIRSLQDCVHKFWEREAVR